MRVAIAIPLRDEEATVDALIDSLLGQTRPPDEIVIADGGSIDRTVELIERRIDRGEPIKLLQIGPAFPGRGRNEAVRATDCDWVAFVDGGIRAAPNWLEQLTDFVARNPETDLVLGNFEPVTDSFFTRCAAIAYVPSRSTVPGGRWRSHFIASSLVRRSLWEQVGGFPEHLRAAEDLVFLETARKLAGSARVGIVPEATVHWQLPADYRRTLRRFRTYARYDLLAGRFENWHRALVRRYLLFGAIAAASGPAAPLTFSGLTLTLLAARSLRSMRAKREFVDDTLRGQAMQFATTASILGLLDFAAFSGLATWIRRDVLQ
jgi:glycosyltransferase involved in cell wall biosynthesis